MEKLQTKGSDLLFLQSNERQLYNLAMQSFRYSQGHVFLQQELFSWMREKQFLDPILPLINAEMPEYIFSLRAPQKHKHESEGERKLVVEEFWRKIRFASLITPQDRMTSEERSKKYEKSILGLMLDQDNKYQTHERQRRNGDEKNVPDSSNDPHASFLRRHAVLGKPTGSREFDALFSDLKPLLWQYKKTEYSPYDYSDDAGLSDKTLILEVLWEQNHPGHSFFPTG
jgi:hypothetical protein